MTASNQPPLLRNLLTLAWPTVLYSWLEVAVGMVDIFYASYIGTDAVAALGFSRQIFLVLMIGTLAITTGTITLVSQYCGAQRYDQAGIAAGQSLLLAILAGIGLGILGALLAEPSLLSLGASADVLVHGVPYLQVLLGFVVFLMINFSTNATFRALGDAKTPLKIAVLVNALNIVFTYVFLFGAFGIPAMGVTGIAIGTVAARAIGGFIAIAMLMRHPKVKLNLSAGLNGPIVSRLLAVGLPTGLSGFLRNGARIVFIGILASTVPGTLAVTAATIGFQIRLFFLMPALGLQVATATLVGKSIGEENPLLAESYGWTVLRFSSTVMALASVFLFLSAEFIVAIFTDNADVLALGGLTLRWIAFEQFCNCISIVVSGVLSGAGDTRPSMRYTLISQWGIMLPLAFWLSSGTMDVQGAWLAWGIAPALQTVLTLIRFRSGVWKTMSVLGHRRTEPVSESD